MSAGKAFGKIIEIRNGERQWMDPLSGRSFIQLRMKKIFPIQKTEDAHDAEPQYRDDQTKSIVLEIAENAIERANETQLLAWRRGERMQSCKIELKDLLRCCI